MHRFVVVLRAQCARSRGDRSPAASLSQQSVFQGVRRKLLRSEQELVDERVRVGADFPLEPPSISSVCRRSASNARLPIREGCPAEPHTRVVRDVRQISRRAAEIPRRQPSAAFAFPPIVGLPQHLPESAPAGVESLSCQDHRRDIRNHRTLLTPRQRRGHALRFYTGGMRTSQPERPSWLQS